MSSEKHEDAWELGTGVNYSVNEVYEMMVERFGEIKKIHIPDQAGNYPSTLRENFDTLARLGWSPSDKLKLYIQSL
jgi:nucleoside-diphosphate-sugar epimerase